MKDISRKSLTAFSSNLVAFDNIDDDDDLELNALEHLPSSNLDFITNPSCWSSKEVMNWFYEISPNCHLEKCVALNGGDLLNMNAEDFEEIAPGIGSELVRLFSRWINLDSPISDFSSDLDWMLDENQITQKSVEKEFVNLQPVQLQLTNYLQPVQLQLTSPSNNPFGGKLKYRDEVTSAILDSNKVQNDPKLYYMKDKNSDDTCMTYTNLLTWSGGTVHYPVDLSMTPSRLETILQPSQPVNVDEPVAALNEIEAIKKRKKITASSPPVKVKNQNSAFKPKREKIRLCNFMRQLLENPESNPSLVKWVDKEEGIFQIISGRSKCVAKLWGEAKNNPEMTFEKLGRSLRWCRDKDREFKKINKSQDIPKKLCFRLCL